MTSYIQARFPFERTEGDGRGERVRDVANQMIKNNNKMLLLEEEKEQVKEQ